MSDPGADGLLAFAEEELRDARRQLDESPKLSFLAESERLVDDLYLSLRARVLRLSDRSLLVELHAAGMLGELTGETSESRFASFVGRLRDPAVRKQIHGTYPLLDPAIQTQCTQWVAASRSMLERLVRDSDELAGEFGARRPSRIEVADSDPHRGGQQVCIITFDGDLRVVYKPRPMRIDTTVAELVAWLADRGLEHDLRVPRTLDRGEYGWAQFIEAAPCAEEAQLVRFHERLGAWLAVLYAMGATDVHLENLVAAGEHPVPIDLETTFHPRLFEARANGVDEIAQDLLDEGVHGVGILPTPMWDEGAGGIVDFSALGAGIRRATGAAIVEAGTDQMRMGVGDLRPVVGRNLGTLQGEAVDPRAYVMALERGYERAVAVIVEAGEAWLAADGPVSRLADVAVRVLVRPTRMYAALLDQLGHPHSLADMHTRDQLIDQLTEHMPAGDWREPYAASERTQLERWDVPLFETLAGGRDVSGADGALVRDIVVRTGGDVARARIAALREDPADRARQLWVVRTSLATRRFGDTIGDGGIRGETLLDVARAAGDRLDRLAIRRDGHATWHAMQFAAGLDDPDDAYRAAVICDDLYGGVGGVVLFLATLARETGEARYRGLAEEAFRTLEAREVEPAGIGAFTGAAGDAYLLTWLATAWERPDLLDRAEARARRIAAQVEHDDILDIVSGAAGAAVALLALDAARPDGPALDAAIRCGQHLRARLPALEQLPMQRGFSHGPSGVAYALALIAHRTCDTQIRKQAIDTCVREAELLDAGRWSDNDVEGQPLQLAWCHGAPGIALSRVHVAALTGDAEVARLAREAVERTAAAPVEPSAGLCHGELGNLEPLLAVNSDALAVRTEHLLARARIVGLMTSMPRGLDTPGLMTGIAGIGMGALRLHAPTDVPSPLSLTLPRPTRSRAQR